MSAIELEPATAKMMIQQLEGSGQPPKTGVRFFTVGLEEYTSCLDEEYLGEMGTLRHRSSTFKLVEAYYGGGKTHFFYVIRDLGSSHGFVTSYVELSRKNSPFDKLELVYKEIAVNLQWPYDPERDDLSEAPGIEGLMRVWHEKVRNDFTPLTREKAQTYVAQLRGIESVSFSNAVRKAFMALVDEDEASFQEILLWLKGEGYDRRVHSRYGILEKIDRTTALRIIRSLAQWIQMAGFSGTIFLFDEGERNISLGTSRERKEAANNMVKIINETSTHRWPGVMFVYSIPDWEQFRGQFGKGGEYVALSQRLQRVFSNKNPLAPRIRLDEITPSDQSRLEFLKELGSRLADIFQIAYGSLPSDKVEQAVKLCSEAAVDLVIDISYKRTFVKAFLATLLEIRSDPEMRLDADKVQTIFDEGVQNLKDQEDEGAEF